MVLPELVCYIGLPNGTDGYHLSFLQVNMCLVIKSVVGWCKCYLVVAYHPKHKNRMARIWYHHNCGYVISKIVEFQLSSWSNTNCNRTSTQLNWTFQWHFKEKKKIKGYNIQIIYFKNHSYPLFPTILACFLADIFIHAIHPFWYQMLWCIFPTLASNLPP